MDNAYQTPRWAQVILWLILIFGITAPLCAEFDPDTLKGMTVLKAGVCDFEGKEEFSFITGQYICVIVSNDVDTLYIVLFDTHSEDLLFVIEAKKVGEEVKTTLVWQKKAPCIGSCA